MAFNFAPASTQQQQTPASTTPAATGFSFGGFGQPAAPAQPAASLQPFSFGTPAPAAAAPSTSTPLPAFGQPAQATSGGFSGFGQPSSAQPSAPASTSQPSNLFSTPAKPSTTPAGTPAPFSFGQASAAGGTAPALTQAAPKPFSFGNSNLATTTPAGQPPKNTGPFSGFSGFSQTAPTLQTAPATTQASSAGMGNAQPAPAASAPSFAGFTGFQAPASSQDQPSTITAASTGARPTFSFPAAQPAGAAPTTEPPKAFSFPGLAPAATTSGPTAASSITAPPEQPKASSGLFSVPASTSSGPATLLPATEPQKTTANTGFSFPTSIPSSSSVPAQTSAPAPSSTPALFSFGKPATPGTTTQVAAPSVSAPSAPSGFFMGAKLGETPVSSTSSSGAPSAAAPTAFSFGTKASTTGPTSTSILGAAAPLGAAANTSTAPRAPPSQLNGLRLDEIVQRWNVELETRVKEYEELAAEVRAWDQVLVQNGEKIGNLYTQLQETEPVQTRIDQALDYIEAQQKELSDMLDTYERQVDQEYSSGIIAQVGGDVRGGGVGADQQREKAYAMANTLNGQLDDLSASLSGLINEVNSLSRSAGMTPAAIDASGDDKNGPPDPVAQIAAILNAHLSSLTWIEASSERLKAQMAEMAPRMIEASAGKWKGLSSQLATQTPGRKSWR